MKKENKMPAQGFWKGVVEAPKKMGAWAKDIWDRGFHGKQSRNRTPTSPTRQSTPPPVARPTPTPLLSSPALSPQNGVPTGTPTVVAPTPLYESETTMIPAGLDEQLARATAATAATNANGPRLGSALSGLEALAERLAASHLAAPVPAPVPAPLVPPTPAPAPTPVPPTVTPTMVAPVAPAPVPTPAPVTPPVAPPPVPTTASDPGATTMVERPETATPVATPVAAAPTAEGVTTVAETARPASTARVEEERAPRLPAMDAVATFESYRDAVESLREHIGATITRRTRILIENTRQTWGRMLGFVALDTMVRRYLDENGQLPPRVYQELIDPVGTAQQRCHEMVEGLRLEDGSVPPPEALTARIEEVYEDRFVPMVQGMLSAGATEPTVTPTPTPTATVTTPTTSTGAPPPPAPAATTTHIPPPAATEPAVRPGPEAAVPPPAASEAEPTLTLAEETVDPANPGETVSFIETGEVAATAPPVSGVAAEAAADGATIIEGAVSGAAATDSEPVTIEVDMEGEQAQKLRPFLSAMLLNDPKFAGELAPTLLADVLANAQADAENVERLGLETWAYNLVLPRATRLGQAFRTYVEEQRQPPIRLKRDTDSTKTLLVVAKALLGGGATPETIATYAEAAIKRGHLEGTIEA